MIEASDAVSAEAKVSADLVRRIGAGDHSAETSMVERYGRGLLLLLRRRTGDAELAQDMRQEVFRIAIEKLRSSPINDSERLAAYLRGVAVNLVSASWRKARRQATSADSEAVEAAAGDDPGPFDRLSRAQVQTAVKALLDELPVPRDREILTRLYLDEQDRESICQALSLEAVHFNRVLFRAKQRFKALLLREGKAEHLWPVE